MEQRSVGFEADYEKHIVTIESDGARTESRELFRLYRDARGRTRMEGSSPGEGGVTLRYAFLTDVQTRRAMVLDLATGKPLKQGHWPRPGGARGGVDPIAGDTGARWPARAKDPGEAQTVEDLGEADVAGLAAHGRRITTASYTVEVWTARAIDQPPLLVKSKEPSREATERLFNIRVGDPDPELFAPLDAP